MLNDPNNLLPNYDNLSIRAYQKIHVDESTDSPGSYPMLGYNTEMANITFKSGEETSFHYPLSGLNSEFFQLPLVSSTLATDGAVVGIAPYKADRVFKLNRGYKYESKWGEALPKWMENGSWLCSWLSGDPCKSDGECVWIDRWYNPDGITKDQAFRASFGDYVYDRVSELTFDPGCYYKYYHIGNDDVNGFVDDLNLDGALVYHFNDWLSMRDNTSYIFHNFINNDFRKNWVNRNDFPNDYAMTFNGEDQDICVMNDPVKTITDSDFSVVTWVKCDDWSNNCLGGIVDNGFRGGWTIGAVNNAVTNFVVFPSKSRPGVSNEDIFNGNLLLMNAAGSTVEVVELGSKYSIVGSFVDIDSYIWLVAYDESDTSKRTLPHVIQIDFDGNIVRNDIIEGLSVSDEHRYDTRIFSLRNDNEIYFTFYVNTTTTNRIHNVYKTNRYGDRNITRIGEPVSESKDGILNINGEPIVMSRGFAYIDNNGDIRTLYNDITNFGMDVDTDEVADGVYKHFVQSGDNITYTDVLQAECDYNGDIWVLFSDSLYKFSYDAVARRFVRLFKISRAGISFSSFGFCNGATYGHITTVCFVTNDVDDVVYLYNAETGEEINQFLIAKNRIHPLSTTHSSYDWWRRFGMKNKIYAKVCMNDGIQSAFSYQNRYTLSYDLSNDAKINYGWHHIALVKKDFTIRLYVDCQLVDSLTININDVSVAYSYRSQIVLGGTAGRRTEINEETAFQNGRSAVALDDVRIYRRALTNDDIYYVYISKFKFNDLKWNIKAENKYYIEEFRRFFRFKMPGSKSAHYRILIGNYGNAKNSVAVRNVIESGIRNALSKVTPVIAENIEIVWE